MAESQTTSSRAGTAFAGLLAAVFVVCILTAFIAFVLFLGWSGFYAREATARKAIEDHGFTDVQMVTNHWISPRLWGGCSNEDTIAWEATGKNAQGKRVHVTACGTLLWKSYTIRIGK